MTDERWRRRLEGGLSDDDLELHLQPIVDPSTGRLRGAESFARLRDAAGGLVRPLDWIPVAERTGAIVDVGRICLPRWTDAAERLGGAVVSFNTSGRQLLDDRFIDAVLALAPAVADRLAIEVHVLQFDVVRGADLAPSFTWTEVPDLEDRLAALRRHGVEVWLDDLGEVPLSEDDPIGHPQIDRVKLDRSLLADERFDRVAAAVHAAGKRSIVEGVETDADVAIVRRAGVELAQGFRYGFATAVADVVHRHAGGDGRFGR